MNRKALLTLCLLVTAATSLAAVPVRGAPSGWEPAALVDDEVGAVIHPRIAMDPWGNAIAAWRQWDGAVSSLYAARFDAATGWGPASLLENQSGPVDELDLAMDSGGNAWVVWTQWDGLEQNVSARRYGFSSGWEGSLETIDDLGNMNSAHDPHVVVNAAGDAALVWRQPSLTPGNPERAYASLWIDGGPWTPAYGVSPPDDPMEVEVAIDELGDTMVVWVNSASDLYGRYYLNDPMSPAWGLPLLIGNGTGSASNPAVAAALGTAWVAWIEIDAGSQSVLARSYDAALGWDVLTPLETSPDQTAWPAIALDGIGSGVALWGTNNGLQWSIVARALTGGAWGPLATVDDPSNAAAYVPRVAFDATGSAIAIWHRSSVSGGEELFAGRYWAEVGWGSPVHLDTNDVTGIDDPRLAAVGGRATVAWRQAGDVWASRFTATDADSDGLEDALEDRLGTDWGARDTDGDGIADGLEVQIGTSPLDSDSDDDGLGDGLEWYTTGSNPLVADSDGGGLPDGFEDAHGFDPANPVDDAGDADGDGLANAAEFAAGTDPRNPDSDGDGALDGADAFPRNAAEKADTDGDGLGDVADLDDDGDGWADAVEGLAGSDALDALSVPADLDGDGIADVLDPDVDGDGVTNTADAFPTDPAETRDFDGDGLGDSADTDDDNDGAPDVTDAFPLNPAEWLDTDADGVGDNADWDDDNDGWADLLEYQAGSNPLSAASRPPDFDGDGTPDLLDADDDNDGVADNADPFPLDPTEWTDTDRDGVGNNADEDDDGDSLADASDPQPLVPNQDIAVTVPPPAPDLDGDGLNDTVDPDDDNDGFLDTVDEFPANGNEWSDTDGDGVGDNADGDDDGDGWADVVETAAGTDPGSGTSTPSDLDGDSVADIYDPDIDGDGAANTADYDPLDPAMTAAPPPAAAPPDYDGDGTADAADSDDDNDGTPDTSDAWPLNANEWEDLDVDGVGDNVDTDDDGDGWADVVELTVKTNPRSATSTPVDANGNGVPDVLETAVTLPAPDLDADGTPDATDADMDGDGASNANDDCARDPRDSVDTDGDGACDNTDQDDDGDGVLDAQDAFPSDPARSMSPAGADLSVMLLVGVLVALAAIAVLQGVQIRKTGSKRSESAISHPEEE